MTFVEHQLRVRFIMQFFEETWKEGPTLQEILSAFSVGQLGGLLNYFFFPMGLSLHRQTLPPFDQMHEHWVPWDYRLRPDQRVALVICDLALFRAMAHMASTDLMDFVDLRPHLKQPKCASRPWNATSPTCSAIGACPSRLCVSVLLSCDLSSFDDKSDGGMACPNWLSRWRGWLVPVVWKFFTFYAGRDYRFSVICIFFGHVAVTTSAGTICTIYIEFGLDGLTV